MPAATPGAARVCSLDDDDGCLRDSDCMAPLVCRMTVCAAECAAARDCPAESTCVDGACLPNDAASCVLDADCPAPLVCSAAQRCVESD